MSDYGIVIYNKDTEVAHIIDKIGATTLCQEYSAWGTYRRANSRNPCENVVLIDSSIRNVDEQLCEKCRSSHGEDFYCRKCGKVVRTQPVYWSFGTMVKSCSRCGDLDDADVIHC